MAKGDVQRSKKQIKIKKKTKPKKTEFNEDDNIEETFSDISDLEGDDDSSKFSTETLKKAIKGLDLKKFGEEFVKGNKIDGEDEKEEEEDELSDTKVSGKIKKPKKDKIKASKKKKTGKTEVKDDEPSTESNAENADTVPSFELTNELIQQANMRTHLIFEPRDKWYFQKMRLEPGLAPQKDIGRNEIEKLRNYACSLLQKDVQIYKRMQKNVHFGTESQGYSSDQRWAHSVANVGTAQDKMAAYTIMIQNSPVHNLAALDTILGKVDIRKKNEFYIAIDTLKPLFLDDLLIKGQPLTPFHLQAFGLLAKIPSYDMKTRNFCLLTWYFEEQLKERYASFVKILDMASKDSMDSTREKAIQTVHHLLSGSPEQEKELLGILANKLGDPVQKIGSVALWKLTRIISDHPQKMPEVAMEMERFLFRPNINARARYYGVCFLNTFLFGPETKQLAEKLVTIYFAIFKMCIRRDEVNSKMLSALLTGVNRAYPYLPKTFDRMDEQMDTLFRLVHTSRFNIAVQTLTLIFQIINSREVSITDRYYSALYRKISDPEFRSIAHPALMVNLLFKSVKTDKSENRPEAFAKRMLQACAYMSPPMACGLVFTVSEIWKKRNQVPQLEPIDPNGLFIKENTRFDKSTAFEESDAEDERYEDVLEEEDKKKKAEELSETNVITKATPSWVHRVNMNRKAPKDVGYNPNERNPEYAGARLARIWELMALSRHFHPSVRHFSQTILNKEHVHYEGDPLQDFTLLRFLDRFVFRNPKRRLPSENSITAQDVVLGKRKAYAPLGLRREAVNAPKVLDRPERKVPLEDIFFHRYFVRKRKDERIAKQKARQEEEEDMADSDSSQEFQEMLENMQPKKQRQLDFASDIKRGQTKKKSKSLKEEEEDEDAGDSDDDDDEDLDFAEDPEYKAVFQKYDKEINMSKQAFQGIDEDEFDEEAMAALQGTTGKRKQWFDEEEAFEGADEPWEQSARRAPKSRKPDRKYGMQTHKILAGAEEFSTILDETAASKVDTIGSDAMVNRDNSSMRQMVWEEKRNKWMRGGDLKSIIRRKSKEKFGKNKSKRKNFRRPNKKR